MFLTHFRSFFCSQENLILEFSIFKFHDVMKCLSIKQEINFTESLGQETQSGDEIWPVYVILQRKQNYKIFFQKLQPETSSRPFFVCKELSTISTGKKLLKKRNNDNNSQTIKICQISKQTSSDPFFKGFFENKKPWYQFPGHMFHRIFDKKFSFIILNKLTKFHDQTVFIFQIIQ